MEFTAKSLLGYLETQSAFTKIALLGDVIFVKNTTKAQVVIKKEGEIKLLTPTGFLISTTDKISIDEINRL